MFTASTCMHRAPYQLLITRDRCYRNLILEHKGSKDLLPSRYSELRHHLLIHRCCSLSCRSGLRISKLFHRNFPNAFTYNIRSLVTLQPRATLLSTRSLCRAAAAAQHANIGGLQL